MSDSHLEQLAITRLATLGTARGARLATELQRGLDQQSTNSETFEEDSDYVRNLRAFAAELNNRPCTTPGDPDDANCSDAACPQHDQYEWCGHGLPVDMCGFPLCQPANEDEAL